jgi:hypothetical protein
METSLIKDSSPLPQTRRGDYPVFLTPTSHSTGKTGGAGLLFSRRKLIAYWQLSFCQMFYEFFGDLGMLLLDQISLSKPFRPLSLVLWSYCLIVIWS